MKDENIYIGKYNTIKQISVRKTLLIFFSLYFTAYLLPWLIYLILALSEVVDSTGSGPAKTFRHEDLVFLMSFFLFVLFFFPIGITGLFLADHVLLLQLIFGYVVYLSILIAMLRHRTWKTLKPIIIAIVFILILNMVGCIRIALTGAFGPAP